MTRWTSIRATAIALAIVTSIPAPADAQGGPPLRDLTLDDLMGVKIQPVFGASERLQPVTEAPASVTIITAEDIKRFGYRTLADILRGVRGFYVSDDRNYSYLGVRGFGLPGDYNTRVLLLVNGHKINDNVYDQAYVGHELGIDPAVFERVEIIRGPASSLYGTSAFFAVVNVVTRSGASMNGAAIEADLGTLGARRTRASFGRDFGGGLDIALSGTYEESDGVDRLFFPAFDSPDTNNGIAANLDGERVGGLYGRFQLHDLSVTTTYGQRRKFVPTASFFSLFNNQDPREQTTDGHFMVDAQYERVVGRTRFSLDGSFDRRTYDGVYAFPGERPEFPRLNNQDAATGTRWAFGGHGTHPLPGRQTITAGVEFLANVAQDQSSFYDDPLIAGLQVDQSSNQGAVYLQDEVRVRPWLLLNGGIRHDRYERFAKTTPRGAVIVMPTANQSFKYLYGRAFRAPNAFELHYYADATSYLRSESIGTHEIVWEQYVGERLRTSVSAYRYAASQLITFDEIDSDIARGQFGYFNRGTVTARGLEFEGEMRTKQGFQALGSLALQRARDEQDAPLTNSPHEMAKLRLNAPGPFPASIASFELQYLGARRTLAGNSTPGATLAHLTFSARLTPSVELIGTIRNMFDETYADPASDEHLDDSIQQNGRTARIGLRWKLWVR